jgi:NADPH-dependent glutamate synthase beta subunit-like oxidoreductase
MVNARTKKILHEALELSADDRALLAAALEASLDDDESADENATAEEEEIERAWAAEIERRAKDVLEGRRHGRPAADAIAEVRAALEAARQQR